MTEWRLNKILVYITLVIYIWCIQDIRDTGADSGRYVHGRPYKGMTWRPALKAGVIKTGSKKSYADGDDAPSVCYNLYDYKRANGTTYDYMICPQEGQTDDYGRCCGDDDRQHCCTWADVMKQTLTLLGYGVLALLGLGLLYVGCVYMKWAR